MSSLFIFVSDPREKENAEAIAAQTGLDVTVVMTDEAGAAAAFREQAFSGMAVAVAKGRLAAALRKETAAVVSEVVLSGQDLAGLLLKARHSLGRDAVHVALIGERYMFSDPEPIAALSGAEVDIFYISADADIPGALERARLSGADLVIGEEAVCREAARAGLRAMLIGAERDSLLAALRTAVRLENTLRREAHQSQEIHQVLQYSSDAIIRLDRDKRILLVSPWAEKALGQDEKALLGKKLTDLDSFAPSAALIRAFEAGQERCSAALQLGSASYMADVMPVSFEGQAEGWILFMREFGAIDDMDERIRQERQRRGFVARETFDTFPSRSPAMRALTEEAEAYAQYDVPVLLTGEPRLPKTRLAECIHNASLRRRNPFVSVDLSTMPPEDQFNLLFGRSGGGDIGLVGQAHKGTLFLLDVHTLVPECQRQLLSILRNGNFRRRDTLEPIPVSIRLICSTFMDLMDMARGDRWMWQLANTLMGIRLELPPIRTIPEDIPAFIGEYMAQTARRFKKKVHITPEAMEHLCRYPWPNNLRDIEYFCIKATMLSRGEEIGLDFVMDRLLPDLAEGEKEQQVHIVADREELALRRALKEAAGSRAAAAERLGISRSTLWRRMKKYSLE